MPDEVGDFLSAYDPEIRELALAMRGVVQRLVPDAQEKVHRPWKTIAYGRGKGSRARKFCAISPHREWVNLQFHNGAALPDPSELLAGTGKAMRHVRIASARDVRSRALAELIRLAAEQAD